MTVGMMNKLMDFLGLGGDPYEAKHEHRTMEDEDWADEEEEMMPPKSTKNSSPPNNIVPLQSVKSQMKVILIEPLSYDETQELADHIRQRRMIIVNLHQLAHDQAKRVVDFLSGTVYAIGGDIHKLGHNIFLCTADNVDIQGNISEQSEGELHSRMR
ncbi:cell division protein SepF [Caldalkalibacillus salinus]|uniref:cell division protein SepF n=1 Tax=Caldalkalibacillus salinus TaxID=2803787 RepID=UPI001F017E7A|nr:cell division protein SepF [Caldalkalibacillus salinus]